MVEYSASLWWIEEYHSSTLSVGDRVRLEKTSEEIFCNRYDDLKVGKCVGADKYGNHYYQNTRYFIGRRMNLIQSNSRLFLQVVVVG